MVFALGAAMTKCTLVTWPPGRLAAWLPEHREQARHHLRQILVATPRILDLDPLQAAQLLR
jgi:hypothetical protein